MKHLETRGSPGTYVLLLELGRDTQLTVGRLGTWLLPSGWYAYVGSALGGVEQRVARHLRSSDVRHWHVDYLRDVAQEGIMLQADGSCQQWLGPDGPYVTLIGGIDDTTGEVPCAVFREQEDAQATCSGCKRWSRSRLATLGLLTLGFRVVLAVALQELLDGQDLDGLRAPFARHLVGGLLHEPQPDALVDDVFGDLGHGGRRAGLLPGLDVDLSTSWAIRCALVPARRPSVVQEGERTTAGPCVKVAC